MNRSQSRSSVAAGGEESEGVSLRKSVLAI